MNRTLLPVLLCLLLFAWRARAGGFTPEQRALLDHIVGSAATEFEQDRSHMDSVLEGLGSAYARSGYDKDPGSRQVLQGLREQADGLKDEIGKLEILINRHGGESDNPAVMLLLLSREQTLGFHIYKWVRSVTELTDLANASVRRDDPPASRLCTAMIETAEAGQETLSTAIQALTGVMETVKTP